MSQKEIVYDLLKERKISYEIINHDAVYTMEEMDNLGITLKGNICKNLFLRDAKGKRHFLVVMSKDKRADLKYFREQLGSTALSFASEERLQKYLGVSKGAVSPFGIINDIDKNVEVIIDKDFIHEKRLGCHPNDNTSTVILAYKDLKKIIEGNGNKITYINVK